MMRDVENSLGYYLARAQAQLLGSESPEEALRGFRSQPLTETDADVGRFYGQGLALLGMGRAEEARAILNNLLADYPDSIPLRIAVARASAAAGDTGSARKIFEDALALFPGNLSLGHRYAEALLAEGQAPLARELLMDYLLDDKIDLETMRLLAKASGESGRMADAHYYMAEYQLMRRNLNGAHTQLQLALKAAEHADEVRRSRIEARLEQVELMAEDGGRRERKDEESDEESSEQRG